MAIRPIVRKDLLILMRDRRALAVLLVMPMVFIAILGFSTGRLLGWQSENARLRLAVVDESGHELVPLIIDRLEVHEGMDLVPVEPWQAARRLVDRGEVTTAIRFGQAFGGRVAVLELRDVLDPQGGRLAGGLESLEVTVYRRPAQAVVGAIVDQMVFAEILRVLLPEVARRHPLAGAMLEAQRSGDPGPTRPTGEAMAATDASASLPDQGQLVYHFIVPAYAVLFAFFLINIMARSFLSERDRGTLRRLLAAPIGSAQLLMGKTLPFFLVSLVQGLVLFAFGRLLFGMSWGPEPLWLLAVIGCTSLAATSLGLLTAVLVRSDAQVSAYANLVVITLAGVSGCFMPREWLPEAMKQISLATPHAWSLIAYDQLLNAPAPDLGRVLGCCGMLLAFSAGFFAVGVWRFRRPI